MLVDFEFGKVKFVNFCSAFVIVLYKSNLLYFQSFKFSSLCNAVAPHHARENVPFL